MTWLTDVKARVDESVERLHQQFGETIYLRQPIPTSPDTLYQEDLTREERVFRLLAIVQQNPSPRTLAKFGRKEPVDLLLTVCRNQLQHAAQFDPNANNYIPNVGVSPQTGDVVLWRGVRHTLVQIGSDLKVTTIEESVTVDPVDATRVDVAVDQQSDLIEQALLAVISTQPDTNFVSMVERGPSLVSAAGVGSTITLTFSERIAVLGNNILRTRVAVNGALVAISSIAADANGAIVVTLAAAVDWASNPPVAITYNAQSLASPILTDALVAEADASIEVQPFANQAVPF